MNGTSPKLTLNAAEVHGWPGPRLSSCLNFDQFPHIELYFIMHVEDVLSFVHDLIIDTALHVLNVINP